ncbi:MAG: 5'-methylthioadenosine/S-adenosylhomocysteine nucleosidase [Chloroflexota bacterium]
MSEVVVLISANVEWQVVKAIFPHAEYQTSPFGEWFTTELHASHSGTASRSTHIVPMLLRDHVIVLHGGWGKIAAAASTQYAIDRWQPDCLVNLGTCGGFASEIEKGEIILAEKTIVYDIIEQMGDYDEHIAHYTTKIDLGWLGDAETYPHKVRRTLLVSGDRDLIVEEIPRLKEKFGAVAGDWESGAIAWVAARNGVRCLILRGVTDLVGAEGGEAYEGNFDVFVEGTKQVMGRLVESLPGWVGVMSDAIPGGVYRKSVGQSEPTLTELLPTNTSLK